MKNNDTRCGFISIVGRPNMGKSTLLNALLGRKISITSRKPQTTRHQIMGVKTTENNQMIFIDTPGLHQSQKKAINRFMNRTALAVFHDMDLILFVIEALRWTDEDEWILKRLIDLQIKTPVILVINKIDQIKDRLQLLPFLQKLAEKYEFYRMIPISAEKHEQLDALEKEISHLLPIGPHHYLPEQLTNRDDRFIAAEMVREKLFRMLGEELPYSTTVTIDLFEDRGSIIHITVTIWIERESQKAIVIGKNGAQLKKVGQMARKDLEEFFGKKVFLSQWVKVKSNWSDDERLLQFLGYSDQ